MKSILYFVIPICLLTLRHPFFYVRLKYHLVFYHFFDWRSSFLPNDGFEKHGPPYDFL